MSLYFEKSSHARMHVRNTYARANTNARKQTNINKHARIHTHVRTCQSRNMKVTLDL